MLLSFLDSSLSVVRFSPTELHSILQTRQTLRRGFACLHLVSSSARHDAQNFRPLPGGRGELDLRWMAIHPSDPDEIAKAPGRRSPAESLLFQLLVHRHHGGRIPGGIERREAADQAFG